MFCLLTRNITHDLLIILFLLYIDITDGAALTIDYFLVTDRWVFKIPSGHGFY